MFLHYSASLDTVNWLRDGFIPKAKPIGSFLRIFVTEAGRKDLFSGGKAKRYGTQELPVAIFQISKNFS